MLRGIVHLDWAREMLTLPAKKCCCVLGLLMLSAAFRLLSASSSASLTVLPLGDGWRSL